PPRKHPKRSLELPAGKNALDSRPRDASEVSAPRSRQVGFHRDSLRARRRGRHPSGDLDAPLQERRRLGRHLWVLRAWQSHRARSPAAALRVRTDRLEEGARAQEVAIRFIETRQLAPAEQGWPPSCEQGVRAKRFGLWPQERWAHEGNSG